MPSVSLETKESLLKLIVPLAQRAGDEILAVVRSGHLGARDKADASPVTLADLRSDEIIAAGLAQASAEPVVSEENLAAIGISDQAAVTEPFGPRTFWLVDPLDGTRDFVAGKETYVVNIALIEDGRPVLGVVHQPARGTTYWAAEGLGAFKDGQRIRNESTRSKLVAYASGSSPSPRGLEFMRKIGVETAHRFGSAIKFCLVAEGLGDLYPRFGPTSEWDTAAGHAILNEAGCHLLSLEDGQPLRYGKPGFRNVGFVASRRDLDFTAAMRETKKGASGR